MGDEGKVKQIHETALRIQDFIDHSSLPDAEKSTIRQEFLSIEALYLDFMENYLDFREISNNLYDGIHIADGKGRIVFINDAYVRTTEVTREQVLGRYVQDIEAEGKLYHGAVTPEVLRRKKRINSVAKIIKNNKDVLVTGTPIFNEEGRIKLVVTNNRDISELKELQNTIAQLTQDQMKVNEELQYLRQQQTPDKKIISSSKAMHGILDLIHVIAPTDVTILITGESGTGKELIADEIYHSSNRNGKPFIKVNCAAIPSELLESELFGYERGAFTDAKKTGKAGMFELANGGTILLDEIGDMPLNLQTKLLRVLQQKEIMRIGGERCIKLNIRLIASTNKNLRDQIRSGLFREDLFYRLNVVPIELSPLRERSEDIQLLAEEFLDSFNKKYDKKVQLGRSAINILKTYTWPGNIRELENLIERIVVTNTDGKIHEAYLLSLLSPENKTMPSLDIEVEYPADHAMTLKQAVENYEIKLIINAIQTCGSKRKAAAVLGIDHSTLVKKCQRLNFNSQLLDR